MTDSKIYDVVIIGGGQSSLACAYHLRRTNLDFIILDEQKKCGGAWLKTWDSLRLFSPAEHSSLPGWSMPKHKDGFPPKDHVINYLCEYEKRYDFSVKRPVTVNSIARNKEVFKIDSSSGKISAKTIISATGTWKVPFIPQVEGRNKFNGIQVHSAHYKNPEIFKGKKVLVVGEGNSGAQILAEVSKVAKTTWATLEEPQYLPDDVDGRVLFDVATAKYKAKKEGRSYTPKNYNLKSIVMVPAVKEARKRGVLQSYGNIQGLTEDAVVFHNEAVKNFDAIIWCTGFKAATGYLKNIAKIDKNGKIKTEGTRAVNSPGLWLVGYGGWTGFASATLIGVGRSARTTVKEIVQYTES